MVKPILNICKTGVTIWNEWADAQGNLGPVYGKQWRYWQCADGRVIDQMSELIEQIRQNPDSRRLIISAWNVGELDKMALPPCHLLFQFYVADKKIILQTNPTLCRCFFRRAI